MFSLPHTRNVSDVVSRSEPTPETKMEYACIDNLSKKLAKGLFILGNLAKDVSCDIPMTS